MGAIRSVSGGVLNYQTNFGRTREQAKTLPYRVRKTLYSHCYLPAIFSPIFARELLSCDEFIPFLHHCHNEYSSPQSPKLIFKNEQIYPIVFRMILHVESVPPGQIVPCAI